MFILGLLKFFTDSIFVLIFKILSFIKSTFFIMERKTIQYTIILNMILLLSINKDMWR